MNVDRNESIREMCVFMNYVCTFPTCVMVINGLCEECV